MHVIKRNGQPERVSFDKVLRRIENMCDGLPKVDPTVVAQKVVNEIIDGIHTSKLDEVAGEICAMMIPKHPQFGMLAARIVVSNLQKEAPPTFTEAMHALHTKGVLADDVWAVVAAHQDTLDKAIDPNRDFLFDYFGFKTLEKSYLQRVDGRIVETPQYMWMRVALGIHKADLQAGIETYNLMSQQYFTHATPTLFNSGTTHPQMSSCFLMSMEDSVSGMYKTISDTAMISKYAGGIGLALSDIRAKGSYIKGTNSYSSGIIPLCRVLNETSRHISQGGDKRKGSFAAYLEPWHADVLDFLNLRKNNGAEEMRARDLFLALWIPDLFMRRVEANLDWTLMCPNECPGLTEVYGPEFDELYETYEREGRGRTKIPAAQLFNLIIESQIETGTPYLLYKDAANAKSNQKNLGTIKSSNLCVAPETEILTREGPRQIQSLDGLWTEVWNGEQWSEVQVVQTGQNQPLLQVEVEVTEVNPRGPGIYTAIAGRHTKYLDCTPYHKFILKDGKTRVAAEDLQSGMQLAMWTRPEDGYEIYQRVGCVKHTGRVDDTYCFKEPLRQAGVFNGILTGQCAEVIEYTNSEQVSVCNLASIVLPKYVDKKAQTFDFKTLRDITAVITRNLNRIIDGNFYPIPETKTSNMKHRPIGIGIQGLADVFAMLKMPFDSEAAAALNREIIENIYYAAMSESCLLACKYGPYDSFHGSPASKGQLQFHLWGGASASSNPHEAGIPQEYPKKTPYLDWEILIRDVQRYGIRNSLLLAPMPTATTSQIMGAQECHEPFTSNIYVRKVLAGEFIVVNKHMVEDLDELGLWTGDMQRAVIAAEGRIQHLLEIPSAIRERYKTAWDIKQRVLINMARDRAPFVCQSQSLNLFIEKPSIPLIKAMHLYAWSTGLKTGCYYLRTKPLAKTQAFTVEPPSCTTCSS